MKKKTNPITAILLIILCCLLIIISYMFYYINQMYQEFEKDIHTQNLHYQLESPTEYTQTIDFLENEIAKYREYVEKQQDYLIKMVSMIGVILTALFGFFEIRGRKDISNIIQEQYANQVEEEMSKFIGGPIKKEYLDKCIKKEESAKRKKILFLLQQKESNNLIEVYDILENQQYQVEKIKVNGKVKNREINSWVEEYNIIIYQVAEAEYRQQGFEPDESVTYARIAKRCNEDKVYGILYCEKNGGLKPELYNPYFYISAANYGLTLMERIVNLLNFV